MVIQRGNKLSQRQSRQLGRRIKVSLKADRRKQAEDAVNIFEGHLVAGDLVEAWRFCKGAYRTAVGREPKPCY